MLHQLTLVAVWVGLKLKPNDIRMSTQLSLPQNGLRVGDQIVAEGDNVSLGNNVGVKNDLRVGNTLYTKRVASPFVTSYHEYNDRTITIDCNYQTHNVILKANATGISFTNVPPASDGSIIVTVYFNQDTVGNRVIAFNTATNIKWPNTGLSAGNPIYPILQTIPNRIDVFKFVTFDGGTSWIGYLDNPVSYIDAPALSYLTTALNAPTVVQERFFTAMPTAHISTASTTPVDLPLTATFTPKYRNSKIEVIFFSTMCFGAAASSQLGATLHRDINGGGYTSLTPKSGGASRYYYGWFYKDSGWDECTLRYFDSPDTILPVTYKLQYFNHSGTGTNYMVHQHMEYGWVIREISQP